MYNEISKTLASPVASQGSQAGEVCVLSALERYSTPSGVNN